MDEWRLVASKYVLRLLLPAEMITLADDSLNRGLYSQAAADLAELRTDRHPSDGEVIPLFLEWLREMGIQLPSPTDATWTLLRHQIGRIVRGDVPALQGLVAVAEVCQSPAFPEDASSRYIGQPFGVTALYAAYATREDLDARPQYVAFRGKHGSEGVAELTSHVERLAKLWWRTHGPSSELAPNSPEASVLISAEVPYHERQLTDLIVSSKYRLSWLVVGAVVAALLVLLVVRQFR